MKTTFETKIKSAKIISFGYLVLACIMVVLFFNVFFSEKTDFDAIVAIYFFAIIVFGIELIHFFLAFSYYPNKYIKNKEKNATHSIDTKYWEDWSHTRGTATMFIYPIPFLSFLDGYNISNILYWIIALAIYIVIILIHLKLKKETKSSCYITEKQITIDFKFLLPDHYKNSDTRTITYYLPLGEDETEHRNIAIINAVKKRKDEIKLEAEENKKIESISKEIAEKMK